MANPRVRMFLGFCLAVALSGLTLADSIERPSRFLPNLDGQLVRVLNPLDGSTWAAWTYTNGSETDIAISRLEVGGVWSVPQRVGLNDGESQRQPALAVDGYGTTYLAFAERGTGRVFVTARGLGAAEWTTPSAITPPGTRASSPAVMIAAGRRLVVGYLADGQVALRELPLLPAVALLGNDGPDPLGNHSWPTDNNDEADDDSMSGEQTVFQPRALRDRDHRENWLE